MNSDKFIVGRNSVLEALKNKMSEINFIICSYKLPKEFRNLANMRQVPVKYCDPKKLKCMFKNVNHQGIAAQIASKRYSTVQDILEVSKKRSQSPFILILDKIQDPHNLGAIIRTAECMGVHGVIIGKRHCVCVNSTVEKCACGALEYLNVARVDSLARTCDFLKSQGIWICGADMSGENFNNLSDWFAGSLALIIGSEGSGISQNLKSKCDILASIPMFGRINSLNASVAAAIFMQKISQCKFFD